MSCKQADAPTSLALTGFIRVEGRINGTKLRGAVRSAVSERAVLPAAIVAAAFASAPAMAVSPFPPEIDLSTLMPNQGGDGSDGFIVNGIGHDPYGNYDGDVSGYSVSGAGDVNGDGIDDFVIGSPFYSTFYSEGDAYVVFGTATGFPAEFYLYNLEAGNGGDGSAGFILHGVGDQTGRSVSGGVDVNGDGFDDVIVGAPGADPGGRSYAGQTYVIFGTDQGFAPEIEASSLLAANGGDGSIGFAINGINEGDGSGLSVSGVGDLNGDGFDDVIIASPVFEPQGEYRGQFYVVFGSSGPFPAELELSSFLPGNGGDGSRGFVLNGIDTGPFEDNEDWVERTGDVNGDGLHDLFVGLPHADVGDRMQAGQGFVVFGRTDGFPPELSLSSLLAANGGDGSAGFAVNGIASLDYSSMAGSAAGDLNGDGTDDLVILAVGADPPGLSRGGQAYVIFGTTQPFPAEFELSTLLPTNGGDGSAGFVLDGEDSSSRIGAVRGAGDVNGDGVSDLILGNPTADPREQSNAGRAYVVFGTPQGFPAESSLADLLVANGGDGSKGFVLNGIDAGDQAGHSVSGAGDVNGDDVDDVIAGATGADPLHGYYTQRNAGETYVIFGRASDLDEDGVRDTSDNCLSIPNPDQRDTNGDGFGNVCDADLNDDCVINFIDLGRMKRVFFTSEPNADLDGSGRVNFTDLGILRGSFFQPPGPSGTLNICDGQAAD